MSEQVIVAGVTYLPSSVIASDFGYSLDYISRLAREGRVEATRVGKKWFVNPDSVERFTEDSKLKKAQINAELSATRKLELSVNAPLKTEEESEINLPIEKRRHRNIATAIVGSSMVMVAGLLVGVFYNPHALMLMGLTSSTIQVGTPQVLVSDNDVIEQKPLNQAVHDSRFASTSPTAGMVIFSQSTSSVTVENVTRSFSDEVKVEFLSESVGQILPVFKSGTSSERYNFVVVPVEDASLSVH